MVPGKEAPSYCFPGWHLRGGSAAAWLAKATYDPLRGPTSCGCRWACEMFVGGSDPPERKTRGFPAPILCAPSHHTCMPLDGAISHCRHCSWSGSLDLASSVFKCNLTYNRFFATSLRAAKQTYRIWAGCGHGMLRDVPRWLRARPWCAVHVQGFENRYTLIKHQTLQVNPYSINSRTQGNLRLKGRSVPLVGLLTAVWRAVPPTLIQVLNLAGFYVQSLLLLE